MNPTSSASGVWATSTPHLKGWVPRAARKLTATLFRALRAQARPDCLSRPRCILTALRILSRCQAQAWATSITALVPESGFTRRITPELPTSLTLVGADRTITSDWNEMVKPITSFCMSSGAAAKSPCEQRMRSRRTRGNTLASPSRHPVWPPYTKTGFRSGKAQVMTGDPAMSSVPRIMLDTPVGRRIDCFRGRWLIWVSGTGRFHWKRFGPPTHRASRATKTASCNCIALATCKPAVATPRARM